VTSETFDNTRMRTGSNLLVFEGMWRTCLTLLAVVIAIPVTLVVHDVAYSLARSIWTGFASANVTNYGFYLHVVKHTRSWNFLEGIGRRTQYA
jgi:multidrug transporter EmrE-like cation transporter